jgi:hypothetical protein
MDLLCAKERYGERAMEVVFDEIVHHLSNKREYFDIFGQYLLAMEDWIRGEIIWLMHQSPLKGKGLFIATNKLVATDDGKKRKPDLQLEFAGQRQFVELKAIVIDPSGDATFDFETHRKLAEEFRKLLSKQDCFISVAYPLTIESLSRWERIIDEVQVQFRVHCARESHFYIDGERQCLVSLWRMRDE